MSAAAAGTEVLRYAAFAEEPSGGNPAGVVLDASGLDEAQMQAIAADVGFSETAFLFPAEAEGERPIRYFSPLAEVPFCGHATIAAAVAHAERSGPGALRLRTRAGAVAVRTQDGPGGAAATLTSVAPSVAPIAPAARPRLLRALRLDEADLDPRLPLQVAFAGAHHPIVALARRDRLSALAYDFGALAQLMGEQGWTTVAVVHREAPDLFHARNPFPPGGIVEDPATGAAAAALGGYLRANALVAPPAVIRIHQGDDMGRPSRLAVAIPAAGGIEVTGRARPMT